MTYDADGQHRPEDIEVLLRTQREAGADVVLGSRFLGGAENMPVSRRWLLKLAATYTRMTTGLHLTDAHNGLRLFTRAAAERMRIWQNRMAHASEMLEWLGSSGLRIAKSPVRSCTPTTRSRRASPSSLPSTSFGISGRAGSINDQAPLIALLLFCALYGWRQRPLSPIVGFLTPLTCGVGIALVIRPDWSSEAARLLGVGRGADLVLYVWTAISILVLANIHFRLRASTA